MNELEKAVVQHCLSQELASAGSGECLLDSIVVLGREVSGAGFLTEIKRSDEAKLFGKETFIGMGIGADLNPEKIQTGYLIYVEGGYLDAVEGYTYGEERWPETVSDVEVYGVLSVRWK